MKITQDFSRYKPWAGAEITYDKIAKADKLDAFEHLLEDLYGGAMDETALNDLLWFEDESILEALGIDDE